MLPRAIEYLFTELAAGPTQIQMEGKPEMTKKRIHVSVKPGMFSSERAVSFQAGGKEYTLLVDQEDVQDDTLLVYVVDQRGEEAIVDLPRDTFTFGNRVRVPSSVLLPA